MTCRQAWLEEESKRIKKEELEALKEKISTLSNAQKSELIKEVLKELKEAEENLESIERRLASTSEDVIALYKQLSSSVYHEKYRVSECIDRLRAL